MYPHRWELSLTGLQRRVLFAAALWRDSVCRELDEGTGYVLPRSQIITLAQQMPGEECSLNIYMCTCVCKCVRTHKCELVLA